MTARYAKRIEAREVDREIAEAASEYGDEAWRVPMRAVDEAEDEWQAPLDG